MTRHSSTIILGTDATFGARNVLASSTELDGNKEFVNKFEEFVVSMDYVNVETTAFEHGKKVVNGVQGGWTSERGVVSPKQLKVDPESTMMLQGRKTSGVSDWLSCTTDGRQYWNNLGALSVRKGHAVA